MAYTTTHSMARECAVEELADAKFLSKQEVLFIIEDLTSKLLKSLVLKQDLELSLASYCSLYGHGHTCNSWIS